MIETVLGQDNLGTLSVFFIVGTKVNNLFCFSVFISERWLWLSKIRTAFLGKLDESLVTAVMVSENLTPVFQKSTVLYIWLLTTRCHNGCWVQRFNVLSEAWTELDKCC